MAMTVNELVAELLVVQQSGQGGVDVVIEDECCACSNAVDNVMFVDDRVREVLGKEVLQPAVVVITG